MSELLLALVVTLVAFTQAQNDQCGSTSYNSSALVHLNNTDHIRQKCDNVAQCCALCHASPDCVGWSFDGEGNLPCKLSPYPPFLVEHSDNPKLGGGAIKKTPAPSGAPNIVFLVCESTDGRTWSPGYQNNIMDHGDALPNIRALQKNGFEFRTHYANAPGSVFFVYEFCK